MLLLRCFVSILVLASIAESRRGGNRRAKLEKQDLKAFQHLNRTENEGNRRGRLFSLFNVVTFNNDPCASTSTNNGVTRNGTCYTTTECEDRGGSANGNCAAGFGVCCIFMIGSNAADSTTVSNNCTYIQNEGYPTAITAASTKSYTVQKCNDDVCFLRLDFDTFTMVGTSGTGNANEGTCIDMFTVTVSTGMQVPTICGENSGQHMYIDIGANSGDTATLTFTTVAAVAGSRMWDIKVTQVECNSASAPRDSCCLQYHTGCSGRLKSFNYDNTNDNHLNNQQYQICIRQECGMCCVEYAVCADQLTTLAANGNPAGWSFDVVMAGVGGAKVDGVCAERDNTRDYIGIQASGAVCSPAGGQCDRAINNRYCGANLNAVAGLAANTPICDCTGPFTVDVHFNSVNDADGILGNTNGARGQSRGFCLDYEQVPC